MSEQQLLRDADIEPTSEVIAKSLGNINDTYIKFMEGHISLLPGRRKDSTKRNCTKTGCGQCTEFWFTHSEHVFS